MKLSWKEEKHRRIEMNKQVLEIAVGAETLKELAKKFIEETTFKVVGVRFDEDHNAWVEVENGL